MYSRAGHTRNLCDGERTRIQRAYRSVNQTQQLVSFINGRIKVARYSFSGPIPPKFEYKLRRHKQSFGKIVTTVVLDKDENLL